MGFFSGKGKGSAENTLIGNVTQRMQDMLLKLILMGQVPCIQVSPISIRPFADTMASFPHILTIPAIVSFLGNSRESVKINKGQLIAVMLCTLSGL